MALFNGLFTINGFVDGFDAKHPDIPQDKLKKVAKADILNPDAIVACESDKDLFTEGEEVYGLKFRKKYRYGKVYVVLLETANEKPNGDE